MIHRYLLSAALLACATAAGAEPAPIPIEHFFSNPDMTGAKMSPDGRHVAVRTLSPHGRSMLSIVDVAARVSTPIAAYGNADVSNAFWLTGDRLAFTVTNVDHRGGVGKPGLFTIDRDGKYRKHITEIIVPERSFAEGAPAQHCCVSEANVRGFNSKGPHMLVRVDYGDGADAELARLDTNTSRYDELRTPAGTYSWLTDPERAVRIAVARKDNHNVIYHSTDGKWRKVYSYEAQADTAYIPLLYLNDAMYVQAANGKDEAAIYRYDLTQGALAPQPLITAPGYDMDGEFVTDDKKMLGFRFNTDAEVTVWFDSAMKAAQQEIDQLLPSTINSISRGINSNTPYVLVDAYSATQPHTYLLYDTVSKQQVKLGAARPHIDAARMAPMSLERYPARDGMPVPAYVTLPQAGPRKKLPTVVLVGEKPWERNGHWEWDPEVQFLASRGYLVLQPEPRGTAGFGLRHRKAGEQQWGRAVQDDIADAVKWAVAQGYADPARVCIAGTGYGGYAAMMELLNHGDLYQCGMTWSGKVDFNDGARDEPKAELSPLHSAARIRHPVLLAYGKEDTKASYQVGRKFFEAVSAGNPKAEWLSYAPSVEDWKTQANRIDLWRQIEAFLGKHIGAR